MTVTVDETDRLDFLHAENGRNAQNTGLNDVDLWIGGLAERVMPFGGMLGSTFEYVFELQLEHLQNGDRFYYLARTAGMNFFNELEQNSFASMIMQNTNAQHLPLDVFSDPGLDPRGRPERPGGQRQPAVQSGRQHRRGQRTDRRPAWSRWSTATRARLTDAAPTIPLSEYNGGDHVVLGGSNGADTLIASIGDDTLWGDGGNDRMEGGDGNDNIDGGAGDDIITDNGGDDVIKGNSGNDVISGGNGST